jgi:hypothetical protein
MNQILLILFVFLEISQSKPSDVTIIKSGPAQYVNRGELLLAEIFPANSRINNKKSSENYSSLKRFNIVWYGELVDSIGPEIAVISSDGYLVTMDNKDIHSIVIYNMSGKLMGDFRITDIISKDDIISNRLLEEGWRNKAQFYFGNPRPNKNYYNSDFYIVLPFGKAIDINLFDGNYSYKSLSEFQYLDSLHTKKYVNESTLVWRTWLDYTSITELLNCINSTK